VKLFIPPDAAHHGASIDIENVPGEADLVASYAPWVSFFSGALGPHSDPPAARRLKT